MEFTSQCTLCNRLLLPIERQYGKYGCGGDKCPAKEEYMKAWKEAALLHEAKLAKERPTAHIDLRGIESYKDWNKKK